MIDIEKLIPHRDRMKLVDEIILVDESSAVTASTVQEKWPLVKNGFVCPIILIELVAQTAGICRGWKALIQNEENTVKRGWIVGIKRADFFIENIPIKTRIITRSETRNTFENYIEIEGVAEKDGEKIADVVLQIIGADNVK